MTYEIHLDFQGPPDPPYLVGTKTLQDGVSSNVTCTSDNGYPAPTLQWYLGSKNITRESNIQSSRNKIHRVDATSVINFTPTVDDHGKLLVCQVFQANAASMKSLNVSEVLRVLCKSDLC